MPEVHLPMVGCGGQANSQTALERRLWFSRNEPRKRSCAGEPLGRQASGIDTELGTLGNLFSMRLAGDQDGEPHEVRADGARRRESTVAFVAAIPGERPCGTAGSSGRITCGHSSVWIPGADWHSLEDERQGCHRRFGCRLWKCSLDSARQSRANLTFDGRTVLHPGRALVGKDSCVLEPRAVFGVRGAPCGGKQAWCCS